MGFIICWLALTLNIYTEAGGEGKQGMEMVADTVITRTLDKRYPDKVDKVIFQKSQFSWTNRLESKDLNGLLKFQRTLFEERKFNEKEHQAFVDAMVIAYKSLQPNYKPKYNFIHFYSGRDKPKWAKGKKVVKHGNHRFIRG